jgi:aldehyde dehydrogenase (NAD+)
MHEKSISSDELYREMRQNIEIHGLLEIERRIILLKKLHKYIFQHREAIAKAIFKDFAKAETETYITEIFPLLSEIRHCLDNIREWTRMRKVGTPLQLFGAKSYVCPEPKGLVLIISPWNYPFLLAISPLVYAIAAGNYALIKPSELSENTSFFLEKIISEVFLNGEARVINGDAEIAKKLTEQPFDHIFFTGSTQVGRFVMLAAAQNLTSVTLELGGKSPVVLGKFAKIKDAARKIAWGKFINAGQTCIAPDFLFAHVSHKENLLAELQAAMVDFYAEKSTEDNFSPDFAKIISEKHYERLAKLAQDAEQKGAKLTYFGKNKPSERLFAPLFILNAHEEMSVMQEEIFGPILPIFFYEKDSDVLNFIRKKIPAKPLAAYIFSENEKEQNFWIKNLYAGGMCVNDCVLHISNPDLPFGGAGLSGIGKSHGIYGFREMSNLKPVFKQRTDFTSLRLLYPPYENQKKKLTELLLKIFG